MPTLKEEELKKYLEAADIEKKVMQGISIRPGAKISSIVNDAENKIRELGGLPAFPVNVSCNEFAAHDTASIDDERVIGERDVVKFDFGVHIDGYIIDAAFTFDLSIKYDRLLEATHKALDNAIAVMRAGKNTAEIGKTIEETIKHYDFRPIENLGGHSLLQYSLHSGIEIPNYAARSGTVLEEGDVIAIEPFATDGAGHVVETSRCEIFSAIALMPTRNALAREIFKRIEQYKELPFAERWVVKNLEEKIALRELLRNGSIRSYPVLKERADGIIAQFETTVVVEKDSVNVLV